MSENKGDDNSTIRNELCTKTDLLEYSSQPIIISPTAEAPPISTEVMLSPKHRLMHRGYSPKNLRTMINWHKRTSSVKIDSSCNLMKVKVVQETPSIEDESPIPRHKRTHSKPVVRKNRRSPEKLFFGNG